VRRAATLVVLAAVLSGCGSGGSGQITVGAARTFDLGGFTPKTFTAGKAEPMSFTIKQPSGAPLTNYKKGAGPHTGVHVIFVRSDLGELVHVHPPIGPDGRVHENIKLPTAGRYRVVVDAYPNLPGALDEVRRLLAPDGRFVAVIPCEGGFGYSLARRFTSKRLFEREFGRDYDWFIRFEHINLPWEIEGELEKRFEVVETRYFPLRIPSVGLNLIIGLTMRPRRA